jgi:Sec-independent protein translocase protein TatA
MGIVTLVINFIVALPKIWAIFKEIAHFISMQKKAAKEIKREESKKQMKDGKTQKEREDAADKYLDSI